MANNARHNVCVPAAGPPALASSRPNPAETAHDPRLGSSGDVWRWWWQAAQTQARQLLTGVWPPVIEVYGPVLEVNEYGLLETDLVVSRFGAGDGSYRRSAIFVVGRPVVMTGALAVSAAVNYRRKIAAARDAI